MLLKKINFSCITLILFLLTINFPTNTKAETQINFIKGNDALIQKMRLYNTHNDSCNNYLERLVILNNIEYYGFDKKIHNDGTIIALDSVADNIINIFNELKKSKFSIGGISPFDGVSIQKFLWLKKTKIDDDYNYTGSYNCRTIVNGKNKSIHSYGLAIDLNPLQNPFIGIDTQNKKIINVIPKDGIYHLNRIKNRPNKPYGVGIIDSKIVDIFKRNGFNIWGGYWDSPIDSHHFQVSRKMTNLLISLPAKDAKSLFQKHVRYINKYGLSLLNSTDIKNINMEILYKTDRNKFFKLINSALNKGY